jgi:hypothetical protein
VEYDSITRDPDHVHTVSRDPVVDLGMDALGVIAVRNTEHLVVNPATVPLGIPAAEEASGAGLRRCRAPGIATRRPRACCARTGRDSGA